MNEQMAADHRRMRSGREAAGSAGAEPEPRLAYMKPEDEWSDKFYAALGELWRALKGTEMPAMGAPPHLVMADLIESVRRAQGAPPQGLAADKLAQIIREEDGDHSLGVGALAERILARLTSSSEATD